MIKAILSGHSKGLGLGIAQALLTRNIPILGLSRTFSHALQEHFPEPLSNQMEIDLGDPTALNQLLNSGVLQEFAASATRLLLINNAGLVSPIGPLIAQSTDAIGRSVQLNVTTPMALCAALSQCIKPTQQLRILHVSSGAGRSAYSGWSVYCATKAALDMHARSVQQDKLPNVSICSLAPGVIDTAMQAEIRQTDEALFPNKSRFVQLNDEGSLDSPAAVGERLVQYLQGDRFGHLAVDDLRSQ